VALPGEGKAYLTFKEFCPRMENALQERRKRLCFERQHRWGSYDQGMGKLSNDWKEAVARKQQRKERDTAEAVDTCP